MRRFLFAVSTALLIVLVPAAIASATTAKVSVGTSSAGSMLVDGHGKSLYMFGADHGSKKSACSGACAHNWPPLVSSKPPKAGSGVSARKLGTFKRADGKTQVTYAGHPLYRFIADQAAGDINGQGLNAFGGVWSLLTPSGAKIVAGGSPSPTPAPTPSPSPGYPY
jgi:predicted lipoprotein with Yx(FWY)xxD motif